MEEGIQVFMGMHLTFLMASSHTALSSYDVCPNNPSVVFSSISYIDAYGYKPISLASSFSSYWITKRYSNRIRSKKI